MQNVILAADMSVTWFLLPLAAVISLVYSTSRYELPEIILRRATRHFVTILVFMAVIFLLLLWLSFRL